MKQKYKTNYLGLLLTISIILTQGILHSQTNDPFLTKPGDDVVITGEYELVIACAETHHELTSYVVEPGADKFSGIRHMLDIPPEVKKDLRPGMKIRIIGKKQKTVEKKMTKGQVRKVMAQFIEKGIGLPHETNDMPSIIKKIIKENAEKDAKPKGGKEDPNHDHGEVQLKPVDDDDEIVVVKIREHIAVTKIDVIK